MAKEQLPRLRLVGVPKLRLELAPEEVEGVAVSLDAEALLARE